MATKHSAPGGPQISFMFPQEHSSHRHMQNLLNYKVKILEQGSVSSTSISVHAVPCTHACTHSLTHTHTHIHTSGNLNTLCCRDLQLTFPSPPQFDSGTGKINGVQAASCNIV